MSDVVLDIKNAVTMPDIFHQYGFEPNRGGFITCPFHSEKTASLKTYDEGRRWKCFGCGEGGDVIRFVMLLFELPFQEAIKQIDQDFMLCLTVKPTLRQYRENQRKIARRQEEICKNQQLDILYQEALNEWIQLDKNRRIYAPKSMLEDLHPLFVESLQKLDYQGYLLDCIDRKRQVI